MPNMTARVVGTLLLVSLSALTVNAKKSKTSDANVVDSGSFGIFKAGKRIATETFKIEQSPTASVTHSEIKADEGSTEMAQSSELQLAANGDIVKYDWRETKPEKLESTLFVGDQILTQRISPGEKEKPQEIPYILPPSTSVLDDYFFVHREIITWKYIASECADLSKCQLPKATVGIIIPRQHTSGSVSMEYLGLGKTQVHGSEAELNHFVLHADETDWSLYLDAQHKLVKVEVPSEHIEAVRD
jgi:hypothetical protein